MSVSDLDSAEDTAASAPNDAEEEEQDEDEDSPAESDVIEEEVYACSNPANSWTLSGRLTLKVYLTIYYVRYLCSFVCFLFN